MVPIKLRLRNFMAYRALDPPLDLTGIHVACLTGPNGAGKSSFLDAVTWALWGQARAKTDDELITLGESEMEVELEFGLGEDTYRALRKRTRAGGRSRAGHSVLELQIADGSGGFRPITGNTLRETERIIQKLLRLDYQTFINSAFLLQGRADEFTLKTPAERKRVLGEVLNLSHYDELEERAKAAGRRLEMDVAVLRREIAELEAQWEQGPQLEAAAEHTETRLKEMGELVQAREQTVGALQQARESRREKEARHHEAVERAEQAKAELTELERRKTDLSARLARYRASLEQRAALEETQQQYQELTAAHSGMNQAMQTLLSLQREESAAAHAQEEAKHKLTTQLHLLEQRVAGLKEQATGLPAYVQAREAAQAQLATVAQQAQELLAQRNSLQESAARLGVLAHTNENIIQQGKDLGAKVKQLSVPGAQGACPLCGTELGPDGHQRIIDEYQQELERQRDLYRSNELERQRIEQERQQLEQSLAQQEASLATQQRDVQSKLTAATQGAENAERAAAELPPLETQVSNLSATLAAEGYAPEAQEALQSVRKRMAALDYDAQRHQEVQEQLKALEPALKGIEELRQAEREMPETEAELGRISAAQERWERSLAEERQRATSLQEELATAPQVEQQLAEAQRALEEAKAGYQEVNQALTRLKVELERRARTESVLQNQRQELASREQELGIYNELATAFSQRGVQALLIEAALPELEDDANELLGRMTDNRLHISLQTQRQLRSGNVRETLDIIIADELGTRAYELYSGGEAFRVNFALRIALSKLLARRAGVALPTLVIDEGFGTQDAAGREKLVDAINAIADYFQRILIITHIEDLKDAFPVRIEVTKTVEGAKAQIIYA